MQDGNLFSVTLNGNTYYYIHNLQNDVVGLVDGTGAEVVNYAYDSWGKLIRVTESASEGIGRKNPFRYRGYCYDEETGLYYLLTRYYDPEVGRFVNADDGALVDISVNALTDKNIDMKLIVSIASLT